MEESNKTFVWKNELKSTTPHKCPVCGGKGLLPNGFYATISNYGTACSTMPEKCISCGGTGIVWSR